MKMEERVLDKMLHIIVMLMKCNLALCLRNELLMLCLY